MKVLQNKLEGKLWLRIKAPATADYLIGKLTKVELTNIRQYLKLKGVSTLKKEELAKIISKELLNRSKEIFAEFDEEVYHLVKDTVNQGGWTEHSSLNIEQILYLRDRGILFPGIVDGRKVLVMASELADSFLQEDGTELYGIVEQNTYWIHLIQGLLYYYGVLSPDQLTEELLKRETIEIKDIPRFAKVLELVQRYYGGYRAFDGGLAHLAVSNPYELQKEQEKRRELSYYPFTTEQLVRAGIKGYQDKNDAFLRFSKFLVTKLGVSKEQSEEMTETCVHYVREGGSLQPLMDYIEERVHFDYSLIKPLMEELVHLSNHSPQWVVKGYAPFELLPRELKNSNKLKVGRNDPCYCGSGKKYKKCCLDKDNKLPMGV